LPITVGNPVLGFHTAPKFKGQGSSSSCPYKQAKDVSAMHGRDVIFDVNVRPHISAKNKNQIK